MLMEVFRIPPRRRARPGPWGTADPDDHHATRRSSVAIVRLGSRPGIAALDRRKSIKNKLKEKEKVHGKEESERKNDNGKGDIKR